MKKLLLIAAVALTCVASGVNAQVANFTYTGVPASVMPGTSFTFNIFLNFTAGGQLADLEGLSYWLYQVMAPGAAFNLSITLRDTTAQGGVGPSLFSDLQSTGLQYPQTMDRINRNPNGTQTSTDLGALAQAPVMNGSYFIAHITLSIAAGAAPGTYTVGNTVAGVAGVGGRISVINDSNGTTAPIAASNFSFTVVPEPSTFALLGVAVVGLGAVAVRRRAAKA